MSLDRLVDEIRQKVDEEIAREKSRLAAEEARINSERDRRVDSIRAESTKQTELEVARERAQRLARAKLEARKKLFEAKERRMAHRLTEARTVLADFTETAEYPPILKRLYAFAVDQLGKQVRVRGRAEDAPRLKTIAGKSFVATPEPITGGLIAETPDGARRVNLSFDELLRLRENEVRELLGA